MLGGRVRQQLRGVQLPECQLDQLELGFGFLNLLGAWIAHQPPARGACMQDKVSHALRVTNGVVDRDGTARPQAQQSEPFAFCGFDDRLQVLDLSL